MLLDPSLTDGVKLPATGPRRAIGILTLVYFAPVVLMMAVMASPFAEGFREAMEKAQLQQQGVAGGPVGDLAYGDSAASAMGPEETEAAIAKARSDLDRLARLLDEERAQGRPLPFDWRGLQSLWTERFPSAPYPLDPFDSTTYGYMREGEGYRLWSTGPDVESFTEDDIVRAWTPRPTA